MPLNCSEANFFSQPSRWGEISLEACRQRLTTARQRAEFDRQVVYRIPLHDLLSVVLRVKGDAFLPRTRNEIGGCMHRSRKDVDAHTNERSETENNSARGRKQTRP